MILFFEGWEHTGKTTLIEEITKKLDFQSFRSTKQINSGINLELAIKYDWRFMLDFLSQINFNICFDRCFISQYVYSFIFRESSIEINYSIEEYTNLFRNYCASLSTFKYKIIYCTRKDYSNEIDEQVDISKVSDAENYYNNFFINYINQENIIICPFENGIKDNFKKIKQEIY